MGQEKRSLVRGTGGAARSKRDTSSSTRGRCSPLQVRPKIERDVFKGYGENAFEETETDRLLQELVRIILKIEVLRHLVGNSHF